MANYSTEGIVLKWTNNLNFCPNYHNSYDVFFGLNLDATIE